MIFLSLFYIYIKLLFVIVKPSSVLSILFREKNTLVPFLAFTDALHFTMKKIHDFCCSWCHIISGSIMKIKSRGYKYAIFENYSDVLLMNYRDFFGRI